MPKNVRKFRSADEVAARQALIQGEGQDIQAPDNLWSVSALKNLSNEDLLFRLKSIDNQYTVMRWRIWWAIRQHFKSDKLFGQYLNELREDSKYAELVGSQTEIYRAYCAGKFCEKWKISSISDAKIPRTAIYVLARQTDDISDAIYREIKHSARRRFMLDEVERLIEQKRAVITIDKKQDSKSIEIMEYDRKPDRRVIEVIDGVAQDDEYVDRSTEESDRIIEHVKPVSLTMPEATAKAQVFEYTPRPAPISIKTTDEITNDQVVDEIMAFVARYNLRWDRLIAVFQLCIEKSRVLPKR
jgi:hypothetical protein